MTKRRRGNGQGTLYRRDGHGPWIAAWFDHDGKRRERSTRTTDKASAERILRKRVTDAALRREGVIDARAEAVSRQGQRPIGEHLADFGRWLESKGDTPKHVAHMTGCLTRLLREVRADSLAELTPSTVLDAVGNRKSDGASARTCNLYLGAIKSLTRWAVRDNRLVVDPLAGLPSLNESTDRRRLRRPLDADELARLIDAAERGPVHIRLTGPDRAMAYRLASGTGFRAGELASLTPASLDLDADPPAVTVKAAYSKRRRDDRQPIRPDLADALRSWLPDRPRDRPLFDLPDKLARMVRVDLRRARAWWIKATTDRRERRERRQSDFLRARDGDGRVVDFHALRATFITMLVKSGASVKEAQDLARHSDPKLTMNVYTRLGVHDLAGALDRMPTATIEQPDRDTLRATGTDDAAGFDHSSRHSSSSANRRDLVRQLAAGIDHAPIPFDAGNPCHTAGIREAARPGAVSSESALCRTRTYDPLIKSQLLCRLS